MRSIIVIGRPSIGSPSKNGSVSTTLKCFIIAKLASTIELISSIIQKTSICAAACQCHTEVMQLELLACSLSTGQRDGTEHVQDLFLL